MGRALSRYGAELMWRVDDGWERIGVSFRRRRVGLTNERLYDGMVRVRGLGWWLGGVYWMRFREHWSEPLEQEEAGS